MTDALGIELEVLWYVGLGVLLTVYAVLDGFDLGVGVLHLFTRGDVERRMSLNSIGPLWDGNEVWLVTFGGALFAGFPEAYAAILSAFYFPVVLLLFFLIGRAVSIEFRSKREAGWWRAYWDFSFAASSTLTLFFFGLLAGNLILGVPIDEQGVIRAGLSTIFRPYPIGVGVLAVLGAAMHASIFLHLKTEGELHERARRWMWRTFFLFLMGWLAVSAATLAVAPHALRNFERWPAAWIVVALHLLAIANVPRAIHQRRAAYAFVSSSATIAALCFLFGMAMFPTFANATNGVGRSIDAWNAASSETTLGIMLLVAISGLPLVLAYTAIVYWVFRGKVKLGSNSY
jgi:cytochrome d ubiquinol oxidase subunit II